MGGPAKSQLVHEVDALGGVIGRLADATALQKRVLNASRGPAVWALRAQTDKRHYARQMLQLLQHTPNLALREAMVTGLEIEGAADGGGPGWDPAQGPAARITGVHTYFGSVYGARPWRSPPAPSWGAGSGWAAGAWRPAAPASRPVKASPKRCSGWASAPIG